LENKKNIPYNIYENILHFQTEVQKYFSFLNEYNYILSEIEIGQKENFLNYFCNFLFINDETIINIEYSTDIINGYNIAFPQIKQKPVIDNLISCNISDSNAFMSIQQFAELFQPQISKNEFSINLDSKNILIEITNVVRNYSIFFQKNLTTVLKKEKIFDCYTDRFNHKVFNEIKYSTK